MVSVISMETWVADDFCGGEGFLNFTSCKILSVASEKHVLKIWVTIQEKPVTLLVVYTVGIVSNYSMTMPCIICGSIVEQNDESSHNRIVEWFVASKIQTSFWKTKEVNFDL